VPDVVGQDIEAATKELEDAGFEVSSVEEESAKPENEVTKQSPSAGVKADDGAKIKLTVATGQNTVPDVVGLAKSDATAQLEEAGFKVKTTNTETNDEADDGNVVSQDPTEGTADVGSTVTLEIGEFVDDGTTP
jgi:serine/threonine-protein kinase